MSFYKMVQEEIRLIQERDPAIHSKMEVFLYPSFKVMLHYRMAHRLYEKGHYFWCYLATVRSCFDRSELPGNPGRILEWYGLCLGGHWYRALAPRLPLEQE